MQRKYGITNYKKIRLIWHSILHIVMNSAKSVKRTNAVGAFGKTEQHHITRQLRLLQHTNKPMSIMKVVTYRNARRAEKITVTLRKINGNLKKVRWNFGKVTLVYFQNKYHTI